MEAGLYGLGRKQGCQPNMQRWNQESKEQMEVNLVRNIKNNRGYHRYLHQKRKFEESVSLLTNEKGELASTDTKKGEVLSKFFSSVFTGSSQYCHIAHIPTWFLGDQNPSHSKQKTSLISSDETEGVQVHRAE